MNLRHATALALVGWYLMMPPWHPVLDVNAPLSRWVPFQEGFMGFCVSSDRRKCFGYSGIEEFRDLAECQETQSHLKKAVKYRAEKNWRGGDRRLEPSIEDFAVTVAHSICIADDDPRLKGNIHYTGN